MAKAAAKNGEISFSLLLPDILFSLIFGRGSYYSYFYLYPFGYPIPLFLKTIKVATLHLR